MTYGDLHLIDILIFGGVAAFLFYRLRGVLGKKTGFEKKHAQNKKPKPANNPLNHSKIPNIPELEENIKELETAYKTLNDFNHISFLEGAKSAFERIVILFNKGDKENLKPLLTKNTHLVFCKTIDLKKENKSNQLLSLKIESIDKVLVEGKKILITITYLSSQINTLTDKEITKKDTWTFEKNISNKGPNWLLSST